MIKKDELQQKLKQLERQERENFHYVWVVTSEGKVISILLKDILVPTERVKWCIRVSENRTEALDPSHFFWNRRRAVESLYRGSRKNDTS